MKKQVWNCMPGSKTLRVLSCAALLVCVSVAFVACGGTPEKVDPPPTPKQEGPFQCNAENVCVLSGTITENVTLTADKKWLLRGGVFIGDETKETILTIEPGTTIYGETSTNGMLVIRRSAKIIAKGEKDKPIVFTSSKSAGSRARGDWGGIIINGRAKINSCAKDTNDKCEAYGEGGTGFYGGDDDSDSSGELRYVRVEFAGRLISPDNELNGIAFQGVGAGTKVEFVQVHMAKDDGVEFFGGTVGVKHILITGVADDGLDWTDGWRGKAQFVVIQQHDDAGDNGIEADNNAENNAATPRSQPTLSNITIIGSPKSSSSDLGVLLREGTAGKLSNLIIMGFNEGCLKLDHKETYDNAVKDDELTGNLLINTSTIQCDKNFVEKDGMPFKVEDFVMKMNAQNKFVDPKLVAPFDFTKVGFLPDTGSPVLTGAKVPEDAFFEKVTYVGAIAPDNDWTQGWTTRERK